MGLAVKIDLPVVIHMHEAEAEMRQVLDQRENYPEGSSTAGRVVRSFWKLC